MAITCITEDDRYFDSDGGIKYSVKFVNFRYYAIPIINVHVVGDGFDFYMYYEVKSLKNETTVVIGETFKSKGNDGSAVCISRISKERIDIIYNNVYKAHEAAEMANNEYEEYSKMPYWKRDILDYHIPEKYHEQIQKLGEQSHDDFDFRLRNVDGVEHCLYFTDDSGDGFDIYTNERLAHHEPQTWTCSRCGRTLPQSCFKKGKFTYNTTQDGKRIVNKYCDDCVDENGKVKSGKKEVKIPVPVKKIVAVKPKHEVT